MRWWFCFWLAPAWALAQLPETPALVIFDFEDLSQSLNADDRDRLRARIASALAGRFKVVPAAQVRAALAPRNSGACLAESCQMEVGRGLAASHTLVGSVRRLDAGCVLTLTLYDLREAVSVAAQAEGPCSGLVDWAQAAVQRLVQGGKGSNTKQAWALGNMVRVPAGPLFMGCNTKVDNACEDDEKPGKIVEVAAFKIDTTEVTVASYVACVKAGGCTTAGLTEYPDCPWDKMNRGDHPVTCVDWDQAAAYCRWAQKRLPTEAEWEKAARGADGRRYAWGNQLDLTKANLNGDGDGFRWGAPVGSFQAGASPYGALDMIGNVWEWVEDWYEPGKYRSLRSSAWKLAPKNARTSARYKSLPGDRSIHLGFRCAQSE